MSDAPTAFPDIDQNVATNLRQFRERNELSQEELAQRMSTLGFGFTQATVWKIESGQRPVRISEAVALGKALGLLSWTYLTATPEISRHHADLASANRRAHQAYEALKDAAETYLETQIEVVIAVREAQDAGIDTDPWSSWLDIPAERGVIEARVKWDQHDEVLEQQDAKAEAILQALREHGHEPPRPEDLEKNPPAQ